MRAGIASWTFRTPATRAAACGFQTSRVVRTVKPIAGDNTAQIQAAIDEVSKLALEPDGFRGAVLLERGRYDVGAEIQHCGQRRRAAGQRIGRERDGAPRHGCAAPGVRVAGAGTWQPDGKPARVSDAYVPAGASSVRVDATAGFRQAIVC